MPKKYIFRKKNAPILFILPRSLTPVGREPEGEPDTSATTRHFGTGAEVSKWFGTEVSSNPWEAYNDHSGFRSALPPARGVPLKDKFLATPIA